jgi:uncharacterized protein YjdB
MRRRRPCISLFLLVAAFACGSETNAPPQTVAVTVAPSSLTLDQGSTSSLTAVVTQSNGQVVGNPAVAWVSANPSIAAAAGTSTIATITGVSAGQTVITATSSGIFGNAAITVRPPPVARVAISLAVTTLLLQGTTQATATVFDAQGRPLTGREIVWASSNTNAAVNPTGVVRGVSKGTSYIKATAEGRADSALVTILGVASVVVQPGSVSMPPRDTVRATATVAVDPGIQNAVLWSSSAPSIATVAPNGLIRGVAPGSVVIRAQAAADLTKYDSVRVTVFDPCTRPAAHTLGSTVSGRIEATDCAGTTDYFEAVLTKPTLYRVSVTSTFPFSVYPYWAIPAGLFFSQPAQTRPAYALAPAGSILIRVVSEDTSKGRDYSMTTVVEPTEDACSIVMGRGLGRTFALVSSCQPNLGGITQTARSFSVPAPTTTSGALVIRANAATYPVRLALSSFGNNGITLLASAVAPASGQDAVLTYGATQSALVLTLTVTGPTTTTTGSFTLAISP